MIFRSSEHEEFYEENIKKCRYTDEEHRALIYTLGITEDCRNNINRIYDFESGMLKPDSIYEDWVTGTDSRVMRLAFNLYNGGVPTAFKLGGSEETDELYRNSVSAIFSYGNVGRYLIEAISIRYEIPLLEREESLYR